MRQELITVVVPVYNVEQYLRCCVDSIRRQTYECMEIILVDDGSPDRCPEICEQIKALDARVKVVHKENGGLGFARNSGLDVATGSYVTFIDSDDWISDDHIENLYREAKRTDADAVIGSYTTVSSNGDVCAYPVKLKQKVYAGPEIQQTIVLPLIGADRRCSQDVQMEASSCMNLYRMDLITGKNIRFPSERVAISEDLFFNIDFFSTAARVAVLNETGYYYFENPTSISRKYDTGRLERTVRFYDAMKEKIAQHGLEADVGHRVERTFLMNIRAAMLMIIRSSMTRKQQIQEIQRILENEQVNKVLSTYPIETYIPAMRLLTKHMRSGNVRWVYWMLKFREYARNSSQLKDLLKRIGIGK